MYTWIDSVHYEESNGAAVLLKCQKKCVILKDENSKMSTEEVYETAYTFLREEMKRDN